MLLGAVGSHTEERSLHGVCVGCHQPSATSSDMHICHLHYCTPGCYIRGHTHPFPSYCCLTAGAPPDRSQYSTTGGLYIYQGHKGCVDGGSIPGSLSEDETRRPSELHCLCAIAQHCLGTRSPHLSLAQYHCLST